MKNLSAFWALLLLSAPLLAQKEAPSPPRTVAFSASAKGDGYLFSASEAPLEQIAGAPPAYWSYYWEFGDGGFSFDKNPMHVYKQEGTYSPMLYATAHYDKGKPPGGRSMEMLADVSGVQTGGLPTAFDSTKIPIRMRAIRPARANEELVCILSYRNMGSVTSDGRIHFFYNEKKFPTPHFEFDSARVHFNEKVDADLSMSLPAEAMPTQGWTLLDLPHSHTGESSLLSADYPPSTIVQNILSTARGEYRTEKMWRFTELEPGEKRNMFLSLRGSDKMLKDTNAMIHVLAVFEPFDPMLAPERFELEFEIVSAHDPNAIVVSDNRINYRTLGNKKIDYKVKFQNNGKGPASSVVLKIEIPEGLNMKKMKALEWAPKCPICPKGPKTSSCLDTLSTNEGLIFTFNKIYLPGSKQEDVSDRDSSKGFVRYRIEADRDMPKYSFRSRAKIIFDKEAPIYTNYTRTRFKVGISPGIKVGWDFVPDSLKSGFFFIGASISPYKSWRMYPQIELLSGLKGLQDLPEEKYVTLTETKNMLTPPFTQLQDTVIVDSLVQMQKGFVSFEVPVLLRKNFGNRLGLGFGISARVSIENGSSRTEVNKEEIKWTAIDGPAGFIAVRNAASFEPVVTTGSFSNTRFQYTAFGDLTFGSVRAGPNLGIRAGAILGKGRAFKPFVQFSVEVKM